MAPSFDITYEDVDDKMSHHPPADNVAADAHDTARKLAIAHAKATLDLLPTCPEKSVAFTKMREALMWVNAAIAVHGPRGHLRTEDLADIRRDFGVGYGNGAHEEPSPL